MSTVTGFYSDTLAKNDRVPQSNGLLNRYTCLQQNYNSLNRKTTPFKVSHDHVFETWSATSKVKKCHARKVTQNSVTSPVCHSNEALVKTAKNTKSYYCTTLTLSHHYLVWKLEALTSNDNILIVNGLIDAYSQINSSSLSRCYIYVWCPFSDKRLD